MAADAVRWRCARCQVSVGRIDGEPTLLPSNWSRSGDQAFCLGCRRALTGEAAVEAAPGSSSPEDLARLRRNALIEFELARAPDAPNRRIAQACRTSGPTVAAVRARLDRPAMADGDLNPRGMT